MSKSMKIPKIGAVVMGSFRHSCHVESDPNAVVGLKGLPKEWENFLSKSGLPKEEILKNPDVVLRVLSNNSKTLAIGGNPDVQCLYSSKQENKTKVQAFCTVSSGANAGAAPFPTTKEYQAQTLNWEKIVKQNVDLDEVYPVRKKVGEGGSGSVYVTANKNAKDPKNLVALKAMNIFKEGDEKTGIVNDMKSIMNEISMMNHCQSCSQIVRFYEAFMVKETPKTLQDKSCKALWIAMEYLPGGSLANLLHVNKNIPDTVTAYVMREMLLGLEFLHKSHRVHRDIKSDNVLLSLEGDVKLADFGFCAQLTEEVKRRKTIIGTPYWMSPELVQGGYDELTDIWSLGITAIECAEGQPPYNQVPPFRVLCMIASMPPPLLHKPKEHSPLLPQFLECCLQIDPKKRWSASRLLTHPFLGMACKRDVLIPLIAKYRAEAGIVDGV